jgi:V/A-type H+-transporting ATPase subunit A
MMKVVGEEGTSLDDYVVYLKSEYLDAVYIQQNSFDPVDAAVSPERQKYVFSQVVEILGASFASRTRTRRGTGSTSSARASWI